MADWLERFETYVSAHLDELGLTPERIAFLPGERAEFANALADYDYMKALVSGAVKRKKNARSTIEQHLRPLVRMIKSNPDVTPEAYGLMGLKMPSANRERQYVGRERPALHLESVGGRVIVHFGTSPTNEHRNGRPKWSLGCNIYRKLPGDEEFQLAGFATSSPFVDKLDKMEGVVHYYARYRGRRNGEEGGGSHMVAVAVLSIADKPGRERRKKAA